MRLAAIITLVAFTAGAAVPAQGKIKGGREVVVHYTNCAVVGTQIIIPAQFVAADVFSQVGIDLRMRPGVPHGTEGTILVEFETGTPADFKPGALAYAYPYEGVHIRILWDRVRAYSNPSIVLGYVMVHEITHILEGEARHSETGIMKANWTSADHAAMESKSFRLAAEDVRLIFQGLDKRDTRTVAVSTTPNATAAVTTSAR
jgi:hypothetical protein